jgi:hypothetical protein
MKKGILYFLHLTYSPIIEGQYSHRTNISR